MKAYLTTAFLARLADEGVGVVLALLALERTGSPAQGAFVLTAWTAPHAVAAAPAGAAAERARSPRLFHAGALAVFGAAIVLLGLGLGRVPTPAVCCVAVVGGSCGPLVTGGLSGLVARLAAAGPARARAYALDATTYNAASVAAPALVGTVGATLGAGTAALLLAASAAGAALLCAALPVAGAGVGAGVGGAGAGPEPQADGGEGGGESGRRSESGFRSANKGGDGNENGSGRRSGSGSGSGGRSGPGGPSGGARPGSWRDQLATGARTLWKVRELRALTVATCVAFLGIGALPVAAVLLAARGGDGGAGGALMTAFALGGLTGSLALARRRSAPDPRRTAVLSLVVTGAALAGAALTGSAPTPGPGLPVALALFALAGLGDGPLLTTTLRMRAEHAPEAVRTQVFTLGAGLKLTAASGGAALAGALSGTSPAVLLLTVAGLQLAAAAVLFALSGSEG
ncbi:MFS transporter [Streptomyces sp. NHF165]|uniref:MFS transporter n=1 Tax=Streptomyces sp. NHF165 TaxID=2175864 RepID=UPI00135A92EA|nr:MFS transporter [Streptomyces sp. NHF165]